MTIFFIEKGDGSCDGGRHVAEIHEEQPDVYRCLECHAAWRKNLRRVILESPYGSKERSVIQRNEAYARDAMHDALKRGDAPMVSHLLYTQVLQDQVPEERTLGIEAGLAWGPAAQATVVYVDFGITPGMEKGIARANEEGRPVEVRRIR